MDTLNLKYLKYFQTLAKCKNFTVAAKECYISQPAFSRCIKQLENQLGVNLIIRDKRNFSLTPAGRSLLRRSTQIINSVDTLKDFLHAQEEQTSHFLTITLMDAISMTKTGDIYNKIKAINTDVRMHFYVRPVYKGLEMLKNNESDIFITYASDIWSPSIDPNVYEYIKIGDERLIPVCHADYKNYDLSDTSVRIPIIAHTHNTTCSICINLLLERHPTCQFDYVLEAEYCSTIYAIMKNGFKGMCWLPYSILKHELGDTLHHLGGGAWDISYDIRAYTKIKSTNNLTQQLMQHL